MKDRRQPKGGYNPRKYDAQGRLDRRKNAADKMAVIVVVVISAALLALVFFYRG